MPTDRLKAKVTGRGVKTRHQTVNGAAADTNIPVSGIAVGDTIVEAIEYDGTTGAFVADRTATTSVTSAGNVQCTASTANNVLQITFRHVAR